MINIISLLLLNERLKHSIKSLQNQRLIQLASWLTSIQIFSFFTVFNKNNFELFNYINKNCIQLNKRQNYLICKHRGTGERRIHASIQGRRAAAVARGKSGSRGWSCCSTLAGASTMQACFLPACQQQHVGRDASERPHHQSWGDANIYFVEKSAR